MILVITPNPAIDITYDIASQENPDEQLVPGTSYRIYNSTKGAGGKGVNVALVLAVLGIDSTVTGFIGEGERNWFTTFISNEAETRQLIADLRSPHLQSTTTGTITQQWITVEQPFMTRQSVAIVDATDATLCNEAGMEVPKAYWEKLEHHISNTVSAGDVVAICGSFPYNTPSGTLARLIAAAHDQSALVLVDTSGPWLKEAALAQADFLKPNHHELFAVTQSEDLHNAVAELHAWGAQYIAVSQGENGMTLFFPPATQTQDHPRSPQTTSSAESSQTQDHASSPQPTPPVESPQTQPSAPLHCKPVRLVQGNPTGAGDASVAAWCLALSNNLQPDDPQWETALHHAVALSAAAVATPTAGQIDKTVYQEFTHTFNLL